MTEIFSTGTFNDLFSNVPFLNIDVDDAIKKVSSYVGLIVVIAVALIVIGLIIKLKGRN